ncbi:DNA topology modulation protein FlaR [Amycolatopsis sp. NPDC004368]
MGVPVTHLDCLYWRPGWVPAPAPEFRAAVSAAVATDGWVIDGNYSSTLDLRLPLADTVVYLDVPRTTSLRRVVLRHLRERGRGTQAPGCVSKLDRDFVRWIWNWPRTHRDGLLAAVRFGSPQARQYMLGSRAEVAAFLVGG